MMFPYQRPVPGIGWITACVVPQHHVEAAGEAGEAAGAVVGMAVVVAADMPEIVVQVDIPAAVEQQSVVEPVGHLHIASHSIPVALAGFAEAEVAVVLRFPLFSLYCYTFKTSIAACDRCYSLFFNNAACGFACQAYHNKHTLTSSCVLFWLRIREDHFTG